MFLAVAADLFAAYIIPVFRRKTSLAELRCAWLQRGDMELVEWLRVFYRGGREREQNPARERFTRPDAVSGQKTSAGVAMRPDSLRCAS